MIFFGNEPRKTRKNTKRCGEGVVYKEESSRIIGAYFAVYKEMGCGFLGASPEEIKTT
jgi:hypothetical protein